jgi:hypothetical protein
LARGYFEVDPAHGMNVTEALLEFHSLDARSFSIRVTRHKSRLHRPSDETQAGARDPFTEARNVARSYLLRTRSVADDDLSSVRARITRGLLHR